MAPALSTGSHCRLDLVASDDRPLSVHLASFVPGQFSNELFALFGISLPEEIARSVPKRRQEFLYGRLAAKQALATLSDSTALSCPDAVGHFRRDIAIGRNREPIWPTGIIGSISHCSGLAAAAVDEKGRRHGLGIDVEHMIGLEARHAIMETAICIEEVELLRRMRLPWSLDVSLTLVFSAKESFYKGLFRTVGRYFGFEAVRLRSFDPDRQCIGLMLSETLCNGFAAAQCVDIGFAWISDRTVLTHFAW